MSKEMRLRVGEAKQRDAGRGKARIDDSTMRTLGIVAGDLIEIRGKRTTATVAWPAYQEDQDKDTVRIDGIHVVVIATHIHRAVCANGGRGIHVAASRV